MLEIRKLESKDYKKAVKFAIVGSSEITMQRHNREIPLTCFIYRKYVV